ncbi:pyridoxamine 5'-phosphate oxidase family protein [Paenibacillus sanguinis]|uniref:pyridoxamine 5'-phosphate oxidase family protein n=1 Tax=Paenibacillus sanguinis TaxID=225906 RepID=UPI000363B001|nr:pyridoxamine 5'-phosphate oxidase family protein [Paenibacillus sanguinis]
MNTEQEFMRMMDIQTELALATSIHDQPNVRIVNFYYDKDVKVLMFTSFAHNSKVKEMEENPNVAFTTVPHEGTQHIKAKGKVRRSRRTVAEVAELFNQKIPGYHEVIELGGEALVLYEIIFDSAMVTLELGQAGRYSLVD